MHYVINIKLIKEYYYFKISFNTCDDWIKDHFDFSHCQYKN